MNKVYTKTGDSGTTGLFGGQRVTKTNQRIVAYGTIDELNAAIGLVAAMHKAEAARLNQAEVLTLLQQIQCQLYNIGAHLATPQVDGQTLTTTLPQLADNTITLLEHSIDKMTAQLPALHQFILPGGSIISSQVHLARTICRRAERTIVRLSEQTTINPLIIRYCNRLSDWLFTLARFYNFILNEPELTWK